MSIINDSIAAVNVQMNDAHHKLAQLEARLEHLLIGEVITPKFDQSTHPTVYEQEMHNLMNRASHVCQRIDDIILRLRV